MRECRLQVVYILLKYFRINNEPVVYKRVYGMAIPIRQGNLGERTRYKPAFVKYACLGICIFN